MPFFSSWPGRSHLFGWERKGGINLVWLLKGEEDASPRGGEGFSAEAGVKKGHGPLSPSLPPMLSHPHVNQKPIISWPGWATPLLCSHFRERCSTYCLYLRKSTEPRWNSEELCWLTVRGLRGCWPLKKASVVWEVGWPRVQQNSSSLQRQFGGEELTLITEFPLWWKLISEVILSNLSNLPPIIRILSSVHVRGILSLCTQGDHELSILDPLHTGRPWTLHFRPPPGYRGDWSIWFKTAAMRPAVCLLCKAGETGILLVGLDTRRYPSAPRASPPAFALGTVCNKMFSAESTAKKFNFRYGEKITLNTSLAMMFLFPGHFPTISLGLLRAMYNILDVLWHLIVLAETSCDGSRSIWVRERKERRKSVWEKRKGRQREERDA